jgi:hypothetical protein
VTNQRFLSAVLLVVLSGVPAAAAVCAALCHSVPVEQAVTAACHVAAHANATARVANAGDDHCGTHRDAVRDVPATGVAARAYTTDAPREALTHASASIRAASRLSTLTAGSPPRGSAHATTPPVLRV